tara:strand:- start:732 stop:1781 length:1050 start_codon:yes stop_codon:yes gene_type:complete
MNKLQNLISLGPYGLNKRQKNKIFNQAIFELNNHHIKNNEIYKRISNHIIWKNRKKIDQFIPIPIRLFKIKDLSSVDKKKIIKKLHSSGTSGHSKSKIFLDRENAIDQVKVLKSIMETILGNKRYPMLIFEKKPDLNKRFEMTASSAAINGFSIFGKDHTFLLDDNNNFMLNEFNQFIKKYEKQKKLIFGFTYNIYKHLLKNNDLKKISNSIIIHGGGWKKLEKLKINNQKFNSLIRKKFNINKIYNYYGLVEQTGSIFLECEKGYMHSSIFSEIIIRNKNLEIQKNGQAGYIQLLSLLPKSYPGHNILTEDLGKIIGEDDCKCGKKGKYFQILGRIKEAEVRGCSDTK